MNSRQVNLYLAGFSHLKPLCDSVDDEFEDFSFYEVLFNGECKSNNDFKACPSGQELLTNAFGIGKCGFQNNILTLIGMRQGTFRPLSFLDQIFGDEN